MAEFCSGPALDRTRVAPQDNAAFFRQYWHYIVKTVQRTGIVNAEDVAMDIFTRFIETDRLGRYDPTMVHVYNGKEHTAAFTTYLRSLVLLYCRSHYAKQYKRAERELLICDAVVDPGTGETWLDRNGDVQPSHEGEAVERLDNAEIVDYVRAYLRKVPRRTHRDICDLPRFFDAWLRQVLLDGEVNTKELAAQFGASPSSVRAWVRYLRTQIDIALEARQ